jgi:DNA-binding CsgD family transcriptional regulator
MVAVTAGELSPIATGIVYYSVIEGCRDVFDLVRSREWTDALSRWCDGQPDLVSFTGKCLMRRAEIMQASGEWSAALADARSSSERFGKDSSDRAAGEALYRQGESLRLQGELDAAERAFADAARCGSDSQPGLALLRLARGNVEAAVAAVRRSLGESSRRLSRATLLPAAVEIMLAAGEFDDARNALAELESLAEGSDNTALAALGAHAWGAVSLADGDAWAALSALRTSVGLWQELQMPYERARSRLLVARAYEAVGDAETASMEHHAACAELARLGAAADLAKIERAASEADTHGLTARELEVVRLLARGDTNRATAGELVISERTVDRHVSNIFAKLRVSSRAA